MDETAEIKDDSICCDALRKLSIEYPAVLERSHSILNMSNGEFWPPTWVIHLYKFTKTERISARSRSSALMSYCPFCGTKLFKAPSEEGAT